MRVIGTIHFIQADSIELEFTLPKGETFKVSYFTDPYDAYIQVSLDNYSTYEHAIVGEYVNSEAYDSYTLTLTKDQIESSCESLVDFGAAIYFYSSKEKYGEFSNFAEYGFPYKGKFYPTVEHFYQSHKFSDSAYTEQIRLASTPKMASDLGKNRNHTLKENWDEVKNEIMFIGVKLKFENHPDLLTALLATGEKLLIENSPYDTYWGIGQDGSGYNHLGTILMRVREMYRAAQEKV